MSKKAKTIPAFKCFRASGHDFHTGKVDYAGALERGESITVADAAPANGQVCWHGIHVCRDPKRTIQFANREYRPWRWQEGTVIEADIIEEDSQKMRVRAFTPVREIFLADIFSSDLADRVTALRREIETWKEIPWLKPRGEVTEKTITGLVNQWRTALSRWVTGTQVLPDGVLVVRTAAAAARGKAC